MRNLVLLFATATAAVACAAQTEDNTYREPLRPQYHYTPAHRWIGDPCGLVRFDGKYHAYSWGCALSDDLVHWQEVNRESLVDVPKGIGRFTGSVVVDKWDSAGYGKDTFIAAFTSFDEASKKQSQSIAHSHDGGLTFNYYDQNPVLDIWSTEFRDPTVIRDMENNRWVMLVARALEKKVAFYASNDLKHWEWLSDFGPEGDNEKSWECPDMFRLPVEGKPGQSKWVLVVSVNWAREQYFVGEFDGTRFIPDTPMQEPLYVDAGLDYYASRAFQDYDGGDNAGDLAGVYSLGWVSTWDYAQHVPTEYGKGVWSLPRELRLKSTPDGLRLVQAPVEALRGLRGENYRRSFTPKAGVTSLSKVAGWDNQYEIVATIDASAPNTVGFNLMAGEGRKLVLSYDTESHTLLLDRTNISIKDMPKFERVAFAKVPSVDGLLTLDIFVDKSVVEIYANGGECVMTALAFPGDNATGAEIFSLRGDTRVTLDAYRIGSIWNK